MSPSSRLSQQFEPAFAIRPSDAIPSDSLKLGDMGLAVAAAHLALEKILRTDKLAYTSCQDLHDFECLGKINLLIYAKPGALRSRMLDLPAPSPYSTASRADDGRARQPDVSPRLPDVYLSFRWTGVTRLRQLLAVAIHIN